MSMSFIDTRIMNVVCRINHTSTTFLRCQRNIRHGKALRLHAMRMHLCGCILIESLDPTFMMSCS